MLDDSGLQSLRDRFTRRPAILRQLQSINDIPAEREPRQPRNSACPYHLIAQEQAPSVFWRKGCGKTLGTLLFRADIVPQEAFVAAKRFFMPSLCFLKLARQHIGCGHREGRALSG